MPKFGDSSNIPPLLPGGDYAFCVTGFECSISSTALTRGAEKYQLELEIEPTGKKVQEHLIDHEKTAWKIDCFVKSSGVKLVKGQAFDFRQDLAEASGVVWVDPIGLRGWCHLKQDTLPLKPGYDKPMIVNKVDVFYTDKPKLPRRVIEVEAEEDRPF